MNELKKKITTSIHPKFTHPTADTTRESHRQLHIHREPPREVGTGTLLLWLPLDRQPLTEVREALKVTEPLSQRSLHATISIVLSSLHSAGEQCHSYWRCH